MTLRIRRLLSWPAAALIASAIMLASALGNWSDQATYAALALALVAFVPLALALTGIDPPAGPRGPETAATAATTAPAPSGPPVAEPPAASPDPRDMAPRLDSGYLTLRLDPDAGPPIEPKPDFRVFAPGLSFVDIDLKLHEGDWDKAALHALFWIQVLAAQLLERRAAQRFDEVESSTKLLDTLLALDPVKVVQSIDEAELRPLLNVWRHDLFSQTLAEAAAEAQTRQITVEEAFTRLAHHQTELEAAWLPMLNDPHLDLRDVALARAHEIHRRTRGDIPY